MFLFVPLRGVNNKAFLGPFWGPLWGPFWALVDLKFAVGGANPPIPMEIAVMDFALQCGTKKTSCDPFIFEWLPYGPKTTLWKTLQFFSDSNGQKRSIKFIQAIKMLEISRNSNRRKNEEKLTVCNRFSKELKNCSPLTLIQVLLQRKCCSKMQMLSIMKIVYETFIVSFTLCGTYGVLICYWTQHLCSNCCWVSAETELGLLRFCWTPKESDDHLLSFYWAATKSVEPLLSLYWASADPFLSIKWAFTESLLSLLAFIDFY